MFFGKKKSQKINFLNNNLLKIFWLLAYTKPTGINVHVIHFSWISSCYLSRVPRDIFPQETMTVTS